MKFKQSLVIAAVGFLGSAGFAIGEGPARDYREASQLSNAKKAQRGSKAVDKIKGTLTYAIKKKDAAQENRDIIQINCVNDTLGDLRGQLLIANKAYQGLQDALQSGDQELIDHEFTKITVAEMRADTFRVDVEGCVGEASKYTGRTVVDLKVDDDIRTDNQAVEPGSEDFVPVDSDRPEAISGSE